MDTVSCAISESSHPVASNPPPTRVSEAVGLPTSVLWDMDGTIIDTEPQWFAAEAILAQRFGGTWNIELGKQLVGRPLTETAHILRSVGRIDLPDGQLIDELISEVVRQVQAGSVDWRPGAVELLADLNSAGVPCALVTASYPALANVVLKMLPKGTFDAIVTGDEVRNGKPDPESYFLAANRLGVEVIKSVAIEDSIPGVASAVASGAKVLAVPAHIEIPPAPTYARIKTLAGVKAADLLPLASG